MVYSRLVSDVFFCVCMNLCKLLSFAYKGRDLF